MASGAAAYLRYLKAKHRLLPTRAVLLVTNPIHSEQDTALVRSFRGFLEVGSERSGVCRTKQRRLLLSREWPPFSDWVLSRVMTPDRHHKRTQVFHNYEGRCSRDEECISERVNEILGDISYFGICLYIAKPMMTLLIFAAVLLTSYKGWSSSSCRHLSYFGAGMTDCVLP